MIHTSDLSFFYFAAAVFSFLTFVVMSANARQDMDALALVKKFDFGPMIADCTFDWFTR